MIPDSHCTPRCRRHHAGFYLSCALLLSCAGCDVKPKAASAVSIPPPVVTVATATSRAQVPIYGEYVATTSAVKSVELRARVNGYLTKRTFQEGTDLSAGDVLYVIDPRPYQAALNQAKATLAKNEAALIYARAQVDRFRPLTAHDELSKSKLDEAVATMNEAKADILASKAAIASAELNLTYCTISAPFNGRIGRTLVNIGNLINSADTVLASIVQLDPIYLYFSPTESEYLEMLAHYGGGEPIGKLTVSMILRNNNSHPHDGVLDFVDNKLDASTGTLAMRAIIPNPDNTLRPGQFAKARVTLSEKTDAILIPEEAIGSDQEGIFVMVVGKDDTVEKRSVSATVRFEDMRVIDSGVKAGERVIVQGLQKVQAGQKVVPKPAKALAFATRTLKT